MGVAEMATYKSWDDAPAILSAQETADLLGIHLNTAKKLLADGEIPGFKLGRVWKVDKVELRRWFEERSHGR